MAGAAYPNGVEPEPKARPGVKLSAYDGEPDRQSIDKLNRLIEAGPFEVHVAHTFSLDRPSTPTGRSTSTTWVSWPCVRHTAAAYRNSGDGHHWTEEWAADSPQVADTRVFTFELVDGYVIRSKSARPRYVQSRVAAPPSKAHISRATAATPKSSSRRPRSV